MKIFKQAQREARQLFRSCQAGGLLDENRVRQAVSLCVKEAARYAGIFVAAAPAGEADLEQHAASVGKRDAAGRRFAGT